MHLPSRYLLVSLALTSFACKTAEGPGAPLASAPLAVAGAPRFCAALRGDEDATFAHVAALARLAELYGPLDALAGGASASITAFLYESIKANPAVGACEAGLCSAAEAGARTALLLKSLQGYLAIVGNGDEAVALKQRLPLAARAKAAGLGDMVAKNQPGFRDALTRVLGANDLRSVVNPEALDLLTHSSRPDVVARNIYAEITAAGDLPPGDRSLLFRPGILDFKALARKLGRIGGFYAGYAPADAKGFSAFLDQCALPGRGKGWIDVADSAVGATTCGDIFQKLVTDYRKLLLVNEGAYPSRVDDPVGKYLPILVAAAMIEGSANVKAFAKARKSYLAGKDAIFAPNFDQVKFGYFGRQADLKMAKANGKRYPDAKTARFLALGPKTWAEALAYSLAVPGQARLLEHGPAELAAGGWVDPAPTLVLKNLGCETVIYVTRQGADSPAAESLARELGMTPETEKTLFTEAPALSLAAADGVWCTNWDGFETTQIAEASEDSFSAPFEVRHSGLETRSFVPYENAKENAGLKGCAAGP